MDHKNSFFYAMLKESRSFLKENMKFLWIVFALAVCNKNFAATTNHLNVATNPQNPTPIDSNKMQEEMVQVMKTEVAKQIEVAKRDLMSKIYAFIQSCIQYLSQLLTDLKAKISHLF